MTLQRFKAVEGEAHIELLADTLVKPGDLLERDSFRVASYNLHNLFGKDNPKTKPASPEQLDALVEVITELDADVLALQEVGDREPLVDILKRVNRRLKGDNGYTVALTPSHDPRGINVAVATRFSERGRFTFQDREFDGIDETMKFSRDLFGVQIAATPTYTFLLFVTHLKSKLARSEEEGRRATRKRGLEAAEIRSILEDKQLGYIKQPLLLAGDMNDDPGTDPIQTLCGQGPKALKDVLAAAHPDDYTYPTHKRRKKRNSTRLDYILASRSIKVADYKIHRDNPLAAVASDHYPVSVTLKVR